MTENRTPIITGLTITEAMNNALDFALESDNTRRGFFNSNALHILNMMIRAESCRYDLDVGKHLWLNRSRWSRLIKEYIVKEKMDLFIEQCRGVVLGAVPLGAVPGFTFSDPQRSVIKHRWGGCLIGATFVGGKKLEMTLTFYSRTSYIGYMGFMDAGIASLIAQKVTEGTDYTVDNIKFVWHISSAQMHYFKIIPYMLSQPRLFKHLQYLEKRRYDIQDQSHAWKQIARFYVRIVDDYNRFGLKMVDKEPYGPLKRIKRRWLEHMGYSPKTPPPSLPLSELDFEKASSDPSFTMLVNSERYPGDYLGKNKELVKQNFEKTKKKKKVADRKAR